MLDLMNKARARQAEEADAADKSLDDRVLAAGLPAKSGGDFNQGRPVTLGGWDLYRSLLEREGALTPQAEEEIRRGREAVLIDDAMLASGDGETAEQDPFRRWKAIVSLGFDADAHYGPEYEKASRASESHRIWERRKQIEERLKAGGTLPDPEHKDAEPILPRFAHLGQGALVTWQAIVELGLSEDPFYRRDREAAFRAMGDVSRRRGDFQKILDSHRNLSNASGDG